MRKLRLKGVEHLGGRSGLTARVQVAALVVGGVECPLLGLGEAD